MKVIDKFLFDQGTGRFFAKVNGSLLPIKSEDGNSFDIQRVTNASLEQITTEGRIVYNEDDDKYYIYVVQDEWPDAADNTASSGVWPLDTYISNKSAMRRYTPDNNPGLFSLDDNVTVVNATSPGFYEVGDVSSIRIYTGTEDNASNPRVNLYCGSFTVNVPLTDIDGEDEPDDSIDFSLVLTSGLTLPDRYLSDEDTLEFESNHTYEFYIINNVFHIIDVTGDVMQPGSSGTGTQGGGTTNPSTGPGGLTPVGGG